MGDLVKRLETEGTDFSKIGRLMGENPAIVRYRYNRLVKKKFFFQGAANHRAIGLKRVTAVVRLSKDFVPVAQKAFWELSESAYLVNVQARVDGTHFLQASVPVELVDEYRLFLTGLKSIGFFTDELDFRTHEWFRILPMKVENYDFDSGLWEMDLSKIVPKAEVKIAPMKLEKFDRIDLLIIRRLQVDGSVPVRAIAKKLGMNYKKVLRHHRHVMDRKLVPFYRLNWLRTSVDPHTKAWLTPLHSFIPVYLDVRDVQGPELDKLMLAVHRLPFASAEMGGPGYSCFLPIPLTLANEVFEYLHQVISDYYGRATLTISEIKDAIAFTVIPELYDQRAHRWTFNPQTTLDRIRSLVPVAAP